MILQALQQYAQTQGLVGEPGFTDRRIHWAVDLDSDGEFLELHDLREGSKGKQFPGCPDTPFSQIISAPRDNPRSQFLAESARLLLDHTASGDNTPAKAVQREKRRRYFAGLLQDLADDVPHLSWIRAAVRFVQSDLAREQALARLVAGRGKPGDILVLTVEGRNPLLDDGWRSWWRQRRQLYLPPGEGSLARDLMTGELTSPVKTLPKIKGLVGVGGLPTGETLVSFDKPSFTSHGWQQNANAPLSDESAATVVASLSRLVEEAPTLAGTKICYWQTPATPRSALNTLLNPTLSFEETGETYSLAVLSGGGGRLRMRGWSQGPVRDLNAAVRLWFEDLAISARWQEELSAPPSLDTLLRALYGERDHQRRTVTAVALLQAAVSAGPLPANLPALALPRNLLDLEEWGHLSPALMGLLRAYHRRRGTFIDPVIDPDHPSLSYHCGRLLAVLRSLQGLVADHEEATRWVVGRYAGASASPATHLNRMTMDTYRRLGRLKIGGERQRLALLTHAGPLMGRWPKVLNAHQQSLFALGYYQQDTATTVERKKMGDDER